MGTPAAQAALVPMPIRALRVHPLIRMGAPLAVVPIPPASTEASPLDSLANATAAFIAPNRIFPVLQ